MGIFIRAIGAFAAAAIVSSAAIMAWQGDHLDQLSERLDRLTGPDPSDVSNMPPLSEVGEKLRAEYLERLGNNRAGGLTQADQCSAYYVALQQSERLKMREEFIQSSQASGHSEQEIDRVIENDKNTDTPYALYAFMMCGNGEKPEPFSSLKF